MGKDAAGGESSSLPPVIRGRHSHEGAPEVGIHWLRGSLEEKVFEPFVKSLHERFGPGERRPFGIWGYDVSLKWTNGITVYFHSIESRYKITGGRFGFECPGGAIETMEPMGFLWFLWSLVYDWQLRPSRLDLCFDDQDRTIVPRTLYSLIYGEDDAGQATKADFTGFRTIQPAFKGGYEGRTYDAVYFGERGKAGCGKYLRVYDKALESDGENRAVRWELELSDHYARLAVAEILDAMAKSDMTEESSCTLVAATIGKVIAGSIDFLHRDQRAGSKNLSRLERYEFWSVILAKLTGRLRLVGRILKKTIERAKRWVGEQMVGTMQMICEATGEQHFFPWLVEQISGERRMNVRHEKAIREYREELRLGAIPA